MTQITVLEIVRECSMAECLTVVQIVGFSAGLEGARSLTELVYLPPAVLTALVYDILSLCCAAARCIAFCCLMLKS